MAITLFDVSDVKKEKVRNMSNSFKQYFQWINPATFYWSTCAKKGKSAVMYLCVRGYWFCIFLLCFYWIFQ